MDVLCTPSDGRHEPGPPNGWPDCYAPNALRRCSAASSTFFRPPGTTPMKRKLSWISPSYWLYVTGTPLDKISMLGLLILVGVAVIFGLDKQFQTFVLESGWYDPIAEFEQSITG